MCLTWQWGKAGLTDWRQSEGSKSNYIDRQLQKKWSNKTNLVMHSTPNNNRVLEAKENIWVATIRKVNWASFCLRSPHKICYTFMVIFFRYCAEYQLGSRNLTSCFKPAMCLPSLLRLCKYKLLCVPYCESCVVITNYFFCWETWIRQYTNTRSQRLPCRAVRDFHIPHV